jgi:hypothetical protein
MDVFLQSLFAEEGIHSESEEKVRPKKRQRTTAVPAPSPHIAIQHTIVAGGEYARGMLQMPPAQRALEKHTTRQPQHVLAPRFEQNDVTLTPPALKPLAELLAERGNWRGLVSANDAVRQCYAIELFGRAHYTQRNPDATATELEAANLVAAATEEQLAQVLAGHLLPPPIEAPQLLGASRPRQPRSIRLIDPVIGPLFPLVYSAGAGGAAAVVDTDAEVPMTKKKSLQNHFKQADAEAHLQYYLDDPEPDPELPFGLPPAMYPSVAALKQEKDAVRERRERMRARGELTPRVSQEEVNRAYADRYRLPCAKFPAEEMRKPCSCEDACQVHQLARKENKPHCGYNPPTFLLPSQERQMHAALKAGGRARELWLQRPAGPCIECTLHDWTVRTKMYQLWQKPDPHPMNTFFVPVGQNEYGRDALLPTTIEGVRTGIEKHVPAYEDCYRHFDQLEDDSFVLREVNVDFHLSLSQMNACLGVRKARPLAGAHGLCAVPLPRDGAMPATFSSAQAAFGTTFAWLVPFGAATSNHNTTAIALLWRRYARSLAMPLLADRALDPSLLTLQAQGSKQATTDTFSRVPSIWLRHTILNNPRELVTSAPALSPAARAVLYKRAPLLLVRRCAQLLLHLPPGVDIDPLPLLTQIEPLFAVLAAMAFGSFEHTLGALLQLPSQSALVMGPLLYFFEVNAEHAKLTRPLGWTPVNAFDRDDTMRASWLLYSTSLWRQAVALMCEKVLRPWLADTSPCPPTQSKYMEMTQYYSCTHDDMLTLHMALADTNAAVGSDRWFLSFSDPDQPEARLTRVYPQSTRVCCADELPDMLPLMRALNMHYDMPSKKQHTSMRDTIAHNYFKTKPHPCQIRGTDNIEYKAMVTYPPIQDLFMLVIRCSLLGNYPKADGRPPLPARLRINAAFAPIGALTGCPESPARSAEVQNWIKQHPMLMLAMLREHYLYIVEASGSIDMLHGQSRNWHIFKAVVRLSSTQLRRSVASMLLADNGQGRMNWDVLERRIDNKTSQGEIVRWHEKEKDHNTKLFKDTDYGIMLKKMTATERTKDRECVVIDEAAAKAWLAVDGRAEAIHVGAWASAHVTHLRFEDGTVRPAVLTGILKCLGMGEVNYRRLRDWLHASVAYHTSDDNFSKLAWLIYQEDWRDFVLLKLYLRLVEHYTDDVVAFASLEHTRAQIIALRASLSVPGYTATPPTLGYGYFCEGCCKWAHAVVRPSREYLGIPKPTDRWRHRHRRSGAHADGAGPAVVYPPVGRNKRKKPPPPRPWQPRTVFVGDGRAGCMKECAFNPLDGHLYCLRGNVDIAALAAAAAANGDGPDAEFASLLQPMEEDEDEEELDSEDDEDAKDDAGNKSDIARVLLEEFSCRRPLVAVDLVGVYKRLQRRLYGRCCYCGRVCEVLSSNMTNLGLSCGDHALPSEYPLWHPIWRHIKRPAEEQQQQEEVLMPRACVKCGHYDTVNATTLWVYDSLYRLAPVTLCGFHAHCLKPILPAAHLGEQSAPVRLARFLQQLRTLDV